MQKISPASEIQDFIDDLEGQGVEYSIVDRDPHVIQVIFRRESKTMPGRFYDYCKPFQKEMEESYLTSLMSNANFPQVYMDKIIAGDVTDTKAVRIFKEYEKLLPRSLLLLGPTDTGKTFGAIWFTVERIKDRRVKSCQFVRANELQKSKTDKGWDFPYKDKGLVVLDDLGVETKTDKVVYLREDYSALLYELINYRMENRLPTIVTSNIGDVDEFDSRYSNRLLKRFNKFGIIQTVDSKIVADQQDVPFD
jgi:hypothetical protein